jgi:ribosomal protein S15P/S13E
MHDKNLKIYSERVEQMKHENRLQDNLISDTKDEMMNEFNIIHNKLSDRITRLEQDIRTLLRENSLNTNHIENHKKDLDK